MTPEQKIKDFRQKYGRRLKAVSLQVTEETADVAYRLVEIRTRDEDSMFLVFDFP